MQKPRFMTLVLLFPFLTLFSFSSQAQLLSSAAEGKLAALALMNNLQIKPIGDELSLIRITSIDSHSAGFETFQVELHHRGAGRIRFLLKGPTDFLQNQNHAWHTLSFVSGFFTGQETVKLLGDQPGAILVGFEYPFSIDEISQDPAKFFHFLRITPGQIALMLSWIQKQKWAAQKGHSIMGVSLGGIFLPVALHLSQEMNLHVEKTIFVCTGADLEGILKANLLQYSPSLAPLVAQSLGALTSPLRPEIHAPFLKSQFLMIRARQDQVIPASSSQRLFEALNGVKEERIIEGEHIQPDKAFMISQIQRIVYDWLSIKD